MRFPRLSQLFHRRSKSDGAIAPRSTLVEPATRPVSTSFLDELVLADSNSLSNVFPGIPVAPLAVSQSPSTPPPRRVATPSSRVNSNPAVPPPVLVSLTQRIRELEGIVQLQLAENRRIPFLEAALDAEHAALQEARETNNMLSADIATLQSDVMQARGELYAALNDRLPAESVPDVTKLDVLTAENERCRKFAEYLLLLLSAGGETPTLVKAYHLVSGAGEEPEEAIVLVIKEEIRKPDSPWRTLLEPIIGQRSPEEYISQVNCTLKARKEAKNWQKKAKFWKDSALEDPKHLTTVTPSVSQLSDVVEKLSTERQGAVDALIERLKSGKYSEAVRRRRHNREPEQESTKNGDIEHQDPPRLPLPTPLSPITESPTVLDTETGTEVPSSSQLGTDSSTNDNTEEAAPSSQTTSKPCPSSLKTSSAIYTNLPPLASVTFREDHSIRDLSASSRRGSIGRFTAASLSAHGISITPSASTSTQESRASQKMLRRKAQVLPTSLSETPEDQSASTEPADCMQPADSARGPRSSSSFAKRLSGLLSGSALGHVSQPSVSSAEPTSYSNDSTPRASLLITPTKASEPSMSSTAESQDSTPRASVVSATTYRSESAPRTSTSTNATSSSTACNTPSHTTTARTSPEPGSDTTPTPSPLKKSRLPIFRVKPVMPTSIPSPIRRLSISRPVLIDTTNAAAEASSPKAKTKKVEGAVAGAGARNQAGGQKGKRVENGEAATAATPTRKKAGSMAVAFGRALPSKGAKASRKMTA